MFEFLLRLKNVRVFVNNKKQNISVKRDISLLLQLPEWW